MRVHRLGLQRTQPGHAPLLQSETHTAAHYRRPFRLALEIVARRSHGPAREGPGDRSRGPARPRTINTRLLPGFKPSRIPIAMKQPHGDQSQGGEVQPQLTARRCRHLGVTLQKPDYRWLDRSCPRLGIALDNGLPSPAAKGLAQGVVTDPGRDPSRPAAVGDVSECAPESCHTGHRSCSAPLPPSPASGGRR